MTVFLLIAVAVLAVFLALNFGALIELHRQLLQLREQAGYVDSIQAIDVPALRLQDLLPVPVSEVTASDRAAIVLLSTGCTTCITIGEHFPSRPREGMFVLIEAHTLEDAAGWAQARGLPLSEHVLFDDGGRVANRLGMDLSPAVVRFEAGYAVTAHTVPSRRQLDAVTNWIIDNTSVGSMGGKA